MAKIRDISQLPSIEYLKEYLKINDDWALEWIKSKRKVKVGNVVQANSRGYIIVGINGHTYSAHRIIWAIFYGKHPEPDREIDHIDGNPSNNNISNLRLCNRSENCRNRGANKNSTSKFKGVNYDSLREKWYASGCDANGIYKSLGRFDDEKDAAIAYNNFAKQEHGAFAKLNVL